MKKKKALRIAATCSLVLILASAGTVFAGCSKDWREEFDVSKPTLTQADGWKQTMDDDFSAYASTQELYEKTDWSPSPHGLRNYEYWCDQMVGIDSQEGAVVIYSRCDTDHVCDVCVDADGVPVRNGVFTGGIETRVMRDGKSVSIFEQAFGYFEATVKVPRGAGMWSAFWLQSADVGKIGNQGEDGTEIDVYESSFGQHNPTQTGNALHYDAYAAPYYRSQGHVQDVGYNLYDGQYHTYGLQWTPEKYVFYVDDEPVWATSYGGVSKVPEFLRLTVEIRDTTFGPYAQVLGKFENHDDNTNNFYIKSVKVWQNDSFLSAVKSPADYLDMKQEWEKRNAILYGVAGVAGTAIIAAAAILIVRKLRKKFASQA